ncbi:MAG TPA: zinc-binding dehydrogenase [Pseudonocardiaceae bacterium]
MRAIQITEFGGPEVLTLTDVPEPQPTGGLELITVESAGVNYADTHQTEDSYLAQQKLPMIPGGEVVGRRADGTRVAAFVASGGYAEKALAHPAAIFEIPEDLDGGVALALLAQGLTAWHLLRTCARMQRGESVVVHAAAGGVGTLAVQLARIFGAGRIIAVASTVEKRTLAVELGADVAVDSRAEDLKAALQEANSGKKVDIVLEMTGGPTFDASLAALAPLGRLIAYGQASGQPPKPIEPGALMARSLTVMGFWLVHLLTRPPMLHEPMAELLGMVQRGELRVIVGGRYPLADARRAHQDLRSRATVGKLVLDV